MEDKETFATPMITVKVQQHFGGTTPPIVVRMRPKKDVSSFINKVKRAKEQASKHCLMFD